MNVDHSEKRFTEYRYISTKKIIKKSEGVILNLKYQIGQADNSATIPRKTKSNWICCNGLNMPGNSKIMYYGILLMCNT